MTNCLLGLSCRKPYSIREDQKPRSAKVEVECVSSGGRQGGGTNVSPSAFTHVLCRLALIVRLLYLRHPDSLSRPTIPSMPRHKSGDSLVELSLPGESVHEGIRTSLCIGLTFGRRTLG